MGGRGRSLRAKRCAALAGLFGHCAAWAFGGFDLEAHTTLSAVSISDAPQAGEVGHIRGQLALTKVSELADAWRRHLIGGLRVDSAGSRCDLEFCGNPPDVEYTLLVGISHYARGRLLMGRSGSLAASLTQAASAFGSETIGADRCLALLLGKCPTLASFSATWELPTFTGWTPSLQLTARSGGVNASVRTDLQVHGGRLMAALSWTDRGNWSLPVGLSIPAGRWRVFALRNMQGGQQQKLEYSSIGVSTHWAGGDWRLQWARYDQAPSVNSKGKVAFGYHRPLDMNWVAFVNVARLEQPHSRHRQALDLGLRWTTR